MKAKVINTKALASATTSPASQPQPASQAASRASLANIFRSNLNNEFKLTPFNIKSADSGVVKYLPPVSKEWKNTIYSYYKKNMQNLPIDNINANKVIRSYFNLHFADNKFIGSNFISPKTRSSLLKKIYVSKIETKHTSSKTIITLYTLNTEKNQVYKSYVKLSKFWENKVLNSFKKGLKQKIRGSALLESKGGNAPLLCTKAVNVNAPALPAKLVNNIALQVQEGNQKKLLISRYKFLTESLPCFNLYLRLYLSRHFKNSYFDKLDLLRKYQLNYYLNKFKFERNTFLHKLSNILSGIFNNNIQFNIINLKSVAFHPDFFTEILSLKLRKPKSFNVINVMDSLLKVAKLPQVNRIQEKSTFNEPRISSLLVNKYPNLSLVSILKKNLGLAGSTKPAGFAKKLGMSSLRKLNLCSGDPLNSLLKKNYLASASEARENNISNIIFNSIKYKNLGGVRLEVKGRLTKRNRADRSVFKFKWKGGLKNIDSSFKGLSTVTYRGYYKPNVIYSLYQSKRRVGSFAVKGWVSGK